MRSAHRRHARGQRLLLRHVRRGQPRTQCLGEDLGENSCSRALEEAGDPLLHRAARDGALAEGVTVADLITLAVGIVLATEQHRDPAAEAGRLFRLAVTGLSPAGGSADRASRQPRGASDGPG
ncbi:SbtR family transcriptional regulator [Streptomyces kroppenstedtii]|uniref:SbtR family transcriptional regulator n=1 Tax=Streptomyces kroppenstedtii TaxID=3051181 RepID=UPI003F9C8231